MKPASINEIKKELKYRSQDQLIEFCLSMARFKLESKELLTYLLFESDNETAYINGVKGLITEQFEDINASNYYFIKKSARKILRQTKRFIRYSKKKETEAELLLHFNSELLRIKPSIKRNKVLTNMYNKQMEMASKAIDKLHDDLKYDLNILLSELPRF